MWDLRAVGDAATNALRLHAQALDEEQSPYGLDALDEVALHALLAAGFTDAGWGALREQRYPSVAGRPRRSEGDRCDIVLTHAPGEHLIDPLMAGTLFAGRGASPEDALWLEIKAAHQFALAGAEAGPNAGYASSLLTNATADVRKLAREPGIRHGATLLVHFALNEEVARHDLALWAHKCLDVGLPIRAPVIDGFPVTDRIGNAFCSVVLTGVSHGPNDPL